MAGGVAADVEDTEVTEATDPTELVDDLRGAGIGGRSLIAGRLGNAIAPERRLAMGRGR